ncbi:hypothetical protein BU15DRAFT_75592 [Melanogaster broomeanus]|nr:hypothetical protein BU15DRAFT_75592 [Melanogaster broomeanus]
MSKANTGKKGEKEKPFGDSTKVTLSDLPLGAILYEEILIHKSDGAYPNSQSATKKAIDANKPVTRYCIVLGKDASSVTVTYVATFNYRPGEAKLPANLEKEKQYWYPVTPAANERQYTPLPAFNKHAQWVSLRKKHKLEFSEKAKIKKYDFTVSTESLEKIQKAMDLLESR